MRVRLKCDFCGKEFFRYPSQIKRFNFCCRGCASMFNSKEHNPEGYTYRSFEKNSKRFTEMNRKLNKFRMSNETRNKLRAVRLNTGEGKSYEKTFGVHTHRVVAEWALGRKLKLGEVVHHIDGDIRNNNPENLAVFASQKEHAKWHAESARRKEVMPHEVHST